MNLPDCIDALPFDEAQRYLNEHPMEEQWSILTILDADPVTDEDLRRLQYIPELNVLKLMTDKITDRGIEYLKWLVNLEWLILYSTQLTDDCLQHTVRLKSLRLVDMQCSPNVTGAAYMHAMQQLPNLRSERYPPFDAETVARLNSSSFTSHAPR